MLHAFKISAFILDALLTASNPLLLTVLPLFLGDLADTVRDFLHDIVNSPELNTLHYFLQNWKKEKITQAQVRTVWGGI